MSLRINTNVAALNSYNNLNANQAKLEGAFQQLSSGLRINKAADDAAGLSIAQGLTSQINGLTQAVSNANDGINVAQIADGALGTTQDILQRMRGLVVKAGNEGTQDSKSRGAIQQEIQNLNTQLDNISKQTKFGQTNLLNGEYDKNFQVGANGGDTIKLDLSQAGVTSSNIGGVNLNNLNIAVSVKPTMAPGTAFATDLATANAMETGAGHEGMDAVKAVLTDAASTGTTVNGVTNVFAADGSTVVGKITAGKDGIYTVSDANGAVVGAVDTATYASDVTSVGVDFKAADLNGSMAYVTGPANASNNELANWIASNTTVTAGANAEFTFTGDAEGGWKVMFDADTSDAPATPATQVGFLTVSGGVYSYHDGNTADGDSAVTAAFNTNAASTTVGGVTKYTSDDAKSDLDNIDAAIGKISEARSQIGAVQNQLGYTVSNLQTAITNVTASRSNLTDADLAQQVTAMTQSQILTQAATSVLAQANSAPQAILKLLQ